MTLLLQHGLDPNVRFSQRSHHILLSLMDMVQNARSPKDLNFVYSLTLTLLQYGANPNMVSTMGSGKAASSLSDPRRPGGRDRRHTNHQVLFNYCQTLINKDQLLSDPDQNFVR